MNDYHIRTFTWGAGPQKVSRTPSPFARRGWLENAACGLAIGGPSHNVVAPTPRCGCLHGAAWHTLATYSRAPATASCMVPRRLLDPGGQALRKQLGYQ